MGHGYIVRRGSSGEGKLDVIKNIQSFTTKRESGTGSITISEDKTVTATTKGTDSANQGHVVYFSNNLFDLSKYKKLHFHVKKTSYGGLRIGFYSTNTSCYAWENHVASQLFPYSMNSVDTDVEVNLEAVDGMCYFGIGMDGSAPSTYIQNTAVLTGVYLE